MFHKPTVPSAQVRLMRDDYSIFLTSTIHTFVENDTEDSLSSRCTALPFAKCCSYILVCRPLMICNKRWWDVGEEA